MSLVNRLAGLNNEAKIAVHQFWGALLEMHYGEVSRDNLISFFNLTGDDITELDVLIAKYQTLTAAKKLEFVHLIHGIFILSEGNIPGYTTGADLNARISGF